MEQRSSASMHNIGCLIKMPICLGPQSYQYWVMCINNVKDEYPPLITPDAFDYSYPKLLDGGNFICPQESNQSPASPKVSQWSQILWGTMPENGNLHNICNWAVSVLHLISTLGPVLFAFCVSWYHMYIGVGLWSLCVLYVVNYFLWPLWPHLWSGWLEIVAYIHGG